MALLGVERLFWNGFDCRDESVLHTGARLTADAPQVFVSYFLAGFYLSGLPKSRVQFRPLHFASIVFGFYTVWFRLSYSFLESILRGSTIDARKDTTDLASPTCSHPIHP